MTPSPAESTPSGACSSRRWTPRQGRRRRRAGPPARRSRAPLPLRPPPGCRCGPADSFCLRMPLCRGPHFCCALLSSLPPCRCTTATTLTAVVVQEPRFSCRSLLSRAPHSRPQMQDSYEFDPLDVTKTWPEDVFPLQPVGHAGAGRGMLGAPAACDTACCRGWQVAASVPQPAPASCAPRCTGPSSGGNCLASLQTPLSPHAPACCPLLATPDPPPVQSLLPPQPPPTPHPTHTHTHTHHTARTPPSLCVPLCSGRRARRGPRRAPEAGEDGKRGDVPAAARSAHGEGGQPLPGEQPAGAAGTGKGAKPAKPARPCCCAVHAAWPWTAASAGRPGHPPRPLPRP